MTQQSMKELFIARRIEVLKGNGRTDYVDILALAEAEWVKYSTSDDWKTSTHKRQPVNKKVGQLIAMAKKNSGYVTGGDVRKLYAS